MLRNTNNAVRNYSFNFAGITMLKISNDSPTSMTICS